MKTIKLYGHLKKRFGTNFKMEVRSAAEAIRALCSQLPGFKEYLLKNSAPGYHVISGKEFLNEKGLLLQNVNNEIKIIPYIKGSGGSPWVQTLVGAVLIAVGVYTGQAWMVSVGASLVIGGVAQILFAPPGRKDPERADNKPSYVFNGPVNTSAQGNPVPILYGLLIVGSQVISGGLSSDQIQV